MDQLLQVIAPHRSKTGPFMSALGLGRVKTFVLATRIENLGAIVEAKS
jgi:hypothetical protein